MAALRPDPRIAASRAALLQAVVELLCEKGVSAVTIDEVLERAKVARATLYRHWPNRRALILDGLAELMKAPAIPLSEGDLGQRLRAYLDVLADQFRGNTVSLARVLPSLLEASRHDPELAQHMPAFHAARRAPIHAIIQDAKAAGEVRQDLDSDTALAELVGPLLFRRLILGETVDQAFRESIVSDFLAAHANTRCGGTDIDLGR
jgi:AcrR family transcriptional regulator